MYRKKLVVLLWILLGILLAVLAFYLISREQSPETMEGTFVQAFKHIGDRYQI